MSRKPANQDMCDGYLDGRDHDAPQPSANRSHSYRHGFKVGRNEIQKPYKPLASFEEVERMADMAMALDVASLACTPAPKSAVQGKAWTT